METPAAAGVAVVVVVSVADAAALDAPDASHSQQQAEQHIPEGLEDGQFGLMALQIWGVGKNLQAMVLLALLMVVVKVPGHKVQPDEDVACSAAFPVQQSVDAG